MENTYTNLIMAFILVFIISIWLLIKKSSSVPINWPVLGMLPGVVLNHQRLRRFMASSMKEKLEHGLIPLLERWCSQGDVIDMQDVFGRLMSDISSMMMIGHDPESLQFHLPSHFFLDVAHHGEEVILMRHLLPESVWKLQRWIGIGKEGILKRVIFKVDDFIYKFIAKKKEEVKRRKEEKRNGNGSDSGVDLFALYIEEGYGRVEQGFKSNDCFLRDTFVTFMLAGQDTVTSALSWFFWLLSKNPRVEAKIKEEMTAQNIIINEDGINININNSLFQGGEDGVTKLVYLHAAINESLRLYPPVPHNHRAACQEETLPSGHKVGPNTIIITCPYVMGRMEELWGKDCLEFKPERWITEQGTIRYEPAHKFLVFNAGPRICLGKDISLMQMKAVILSILGRNYRFEVVKGHRIEPKFSVVLHMKHGLKVRVIKD
ncbi:hypothetical protein V2J09_009797 [Rumex salicifolius]